MHQLGLYVVNENVFNDGLELYLPYNGRVSINITATNRISWDNYEDESPPSSLSYGVTDIYDYASDA